MGRRSLVRSDRGVFRRKVKVNSSFGQFTDFNITLSIGQIHQNQFKAGSNWVISLGVAPDTQPSRDHV